jgi:hypothetical protein
MWVGTDASVTTVCTTLTQPCPPALPILIIHSAFTHHFGKIINNGTPSNACLQHIQFDRQAVVSFRVGVWFVGLHDSGLEVPCTFFKAAAIKDVTSNQHFLAKKTTSEVLKPGTDGTEFNHTKVD